MLGCPIAFGKPAEEPKSHHRRSPSTLLMTNPTASAGESALLRDPAVLPGVSKTEKGPEVLLTCR